jgi:hypothetical protein
VSLEAAALTRTTIEKYFPDGRARYRIVPLPDHRCVYVKNLKAGCSTVTLWLHRIHTGDHDFAPDTTRHHEFRRLPRPGGVAWPRVARMLAGGAFRFTFVRDPIERAESAYRDKILGNDSLRAQLREHAGLPGEPGDPVSLGEFVAALEATDPLMMDAHWRPQHLNLMHPLVEYDLIGRLENFETDLERVREAAGLPHVSVEIRNRSANSRVSLMDGKPDLRRRLEAVYARDYELYDY